MFQLIMMKLKLIMMTHTDNPLLTQKAKKTVQFIFLTSEVIIAS